MKRAPLLFLNVFVIATCGLIYELLAGTLSSYVLGDSVTQFSLIIGIYLFAMGVGSWLSRFIDKHVAEKFIDIELAVAVIGGFSAPLLFHTLCNECGCWTDNPAYALYSTLGCNNFRILPRWFGCYAC